MSADRRRLGRILVGAVSEPGTASRDALADLVAGRDITGLPDLAVAHHVSNAVYQALRPLEGVDGSALGRIEQHYRAALRRHLRALVDLAAVGDLFAPVDLPWLVVKGPVLSERLYGPSSPRNYADLDVVVPRRDFRGAVQRCLDAGLPVVQNDWAVAAEELAGEVCTILPSGTAMDLHWELQYHARSRARFSTRLAEMLERAVLVDIAGTRLRTLDPADTLLHLALHAATGGGGRLQWIKDIERAVTVGQPDWDEVVVRARAYGLAVVVGVMLDRARDVLAAPVPDGVSAALGAPTWRRIVRGAARISPIERSAGRRALSTIVVRSTGPTTRSSLRGLAQQARAASHPPAGPKSHVEVLRGHDPALAAFLDAVSGPSAAEPAALHHSAEVPA